MVEYHVDTLPQFQYIVDKIGDKKKFGGWLNVKMYLGELSVIYLGQYDAILRQYISTKNM